MIYDFVLWLIDGKSYDNVSNCDDKGAAKDNLVVIAVCNNIIGKSRHVHTHITMGLALYAHHEFHSRELVEDLTALDPCVPYDQVCKFLTSSAMDQQSGETYIPRGLQGHNGILVDEAIANFDKNEDMMDGKSTTHALAAVVYQ
jgi:hypothetical protein